MSERNYLFSKLPKVDQILLNDDIVSLLKQSPRDVVIETIREEIDIMRKEIAKGILTEEKLQNRINSLAKTVVLKVNKKLSIKLKKVINGTGIIIHTNLGRSLIGKETMEIISEIASNYSNLEYDLDKGIRGSRYSHVEEIITRITGAESALVVNNNAAAVLLVLSSLAKDKEVIVSRGELVEIGGSFRVPDVMAQSGATLVEVGTTNKTHSWDYENNINENTAALMKVHTSNYRILGFTASVDLAELVEIGKRNNIPVIEDLGSGVLIDLSKYGLEHEPTVQDSVKAGVDIVTFSGDKLLGGPQAGIIIGKKKYIEIMKKNPLTRAIRVDKFTLSALEATLRLYLNEKEAIKKIPTLRMITMSINEIEEKAKTLLKGIEQKVGDSLNIKIEDEFSQVGGGSLPLEEIPTKVLVISSDKLSISTLERNLRDLDTPIITRLYKDRMLIDLRTVDEDDFDLIADGFSKVVHSI